MAEVYPTHERYIAKQERMAFRRFRVNAFATGNPVWGKFGVGRDFGALNPAMHVADNILAKSFTILLLLL